MLSLGLAAAVLFEYRQTNLGRNKDCNEQHYTDATRPTELLICRAFHRARIGACVAPGKPFLLHAHPPCPGSDPIDEVRRGGFETRPYTSAEQPASGARPAPDCQAAIRLRDYVLLVYFFSLSTVLAMRKQSTPTGMPQ